MFVHHGDKTKRRGPEKVGGWLAGEAFNLPGYHTSCEPQTVPDRCAVNKPGGQRAL